MLPEPRAARCQVTRRLLVSLRPSTSLSSQGSFRCLLLSPLQTLGHQLLQEVPHAHLLPPSPGGQSEEPEAGPNEEEMMR